jgi:hypothetical protein
MTVVNLSATTFPQTLDWMHSYLLEVLSLMAFTRMLLLHGRFGLNWVFYVLKVARWQSIRNWRILNILIDLGTCYCLVGFHYWVKRSFYRYPLHLCFCIVVQCIEQGSTPPKDSRAGSWGSSRCVVYTSIPARYLVASIGNDCIQGYIDFQQL